MTNQVYPLNFKPGTNRDGTIFDGEYYVDTKWCRIYRGKPKKVGGYKSVYDQYEEITRGECLNIPSGSFNYIYSGSRSQLQMLQVTRNGTPGVVADRTPSGFTNHDDNEWKMTAIYNSSGTEMAVVAMATQTLNDISDTTDRDIYYGMHTNTTALVSLGFQVSGGVVALPPYLFAYGNDGYLAWSDKNAIATIGAGAGGDAGDARIAATKVVKGIPIRGGSSNSPSGLFWSLDTLQRISFVGGSAVFSNDTVASDISILSTNAVIDYDGVIYWPGVDRYLMYNGVVREVENNLSLDWFYNNYNKSCPQKIWAYKIPRYGEIWYHFPYGSATECTHAVIQNIRENTWYDTVLPEGGRSAGIPPKSTFPYPVAFGVAPDPVLGRYNLWMHEFGVDKVVGTQALAIDSFFETGDIAYMANGPMNSGWMGDNHWVRMVRFEPDFVLSGSLKITLKGRQFADSPDNTPKTYEYDGTTSFKVDSRKQYRQMRVQVQSNQEGGNYYMGQPVMELAKGDVRATSGSST